jgi:hypothetical protein
MAGIAQMLAVALVVTGLLGSATSHDTVAQATSCASRPEGCTAEAGEDAALIQLKSPSAAAGQETCGPRVANSPAEYVSCWEDGVFCCVSSKLFGSVMPPVPGPDATVYPENRTFAWFGSTDDLQTALQLRKKFGAGSPQITIGIQVAVGFNPMFPSWADEKAPSTDPGFFWLVLEQPENLTLYAPTFAEWFNIYTHRGFQFSYAAVKETLLAYANLGSNGDPGDVVQAWVKLTGCSRECSLPLAGKSVQISAQCGCNTDALQAWAVVEPWTEDTTPGNSDACFQALFDKYPEASAAMLRVAFLACNDMLPVYTGFGLGYNTIVNPIMCKGPFNCHWPVDARYAGREFVMENLKMSQLNSTGTARQIPLAQVPEAALNSPVLTQAFC